VEGTFGMALSVWPIIRDTIYPLPGMRITSSAVHLEMEVEQNIVLLYLRHWNDEWRLDFTLKKLKCRKGCVYFWRTDVGVVAWWLRSCYDTVSVQDRYYRRNIWVFYGGDDRHMSRSCCCYVYNMNVLNCVRSAYLILCTYEGGGKECCVH
jgi:hypothetical protein